MRAAEAAALVLEALDRSQEVAEVVVLESTLPDVAPGSRLLVWPDRVRGALGHPAAMAEAVQAARDALTTRRTLTRTLAVEGGACTLFVEPHAPPPELVVVGAGHIARPLCRLGAMLGFRVVVLDDRPEFATRERFPEAARVARADFASLPRDLPLGPGSHLVLVTRGHKYDFEVLRHLLYQPVRPAYIGMVGSQRRVRAALEQLAAEGIPLERLREIRAPIGLDVGAETPEEIAVAIAAELIQTRRGGTGTPLRDRARVVERWLKDENR